MTESHFFNISNSNIFCVYLLIVVMLIETQILYQSLIQVLILTAMDENTFNCAWIGQVRGSDDTVPPLV